MTRIKSEAGKAEKQPSVMVRGADDDQGGDLTAPSAGLLARGIPGVQMPRPGAGQGAGAVPSAPTGITMPRPGAGQGAGAVPSAPTGTSMPGAGPEIGTVPRQAHILQKRDGGTLGQAVERGAPAVEGLVGFDYPATLRSSTAHFNVYYDPSLGGNGPIIADAVLASCEWEYSTLQTYFDGVTPPGLPFNIIIVPGIGGAYHWGCGAVDLYCDGDTSATPDVNHTRMLVVAEEVEVFSAAQGRGWDCGASNGEGLSRVLATQLYAAELDGFESASTWLNTAGRPDYVTINDPTDRSYVSTGCSVLFLNFLRHQLRFSWEEIVRAAAPTLEQTYTTLTGRSDGLTRFKSLLQAYYPEGTPVALSTDNVFPLPGLMEVFARGSDGAVWHQTQVAPSDGWGGWSSLGGWVDMIEVGQNDDLRLEIFARGGDGALWHNWQTAPNGAWSGWGSMGGWIDILELGQNADGRLEIFARGGDGALWHNWQTAPSNGWSGWASMGGWIDILALGRNADGRLEIFARGSDGALWHNWQTAPSNGWSGWASMGGWIDMIEIAQNADGRLEIFARGSDGALWHNWHTAPTNGWSGWASMGGWIDMLAVAQNDDGRIEVFARGSDGALWHNWQVAPNNGWSGWASMGGWIDLLEVWPEIPGQ
jgi:hypothetical protein